MECENERSYIPVPPSSSKDISLNYSVNSETTESDFPVLSDEQRKALDAVKQGKNVFITGSAGVGKSFLLNEVLKALPKTVTNVTASTGVAACNIGGTTLHSFASIGLGEKPAVVLANAIMFKKWKVEAYERWRECEILVIDEISMIDGNLFEKVEEVARLVRQQNQPFGGIQIVLCGDFLQLPPVKVVKFAFETDAWKSVLDETILLKQVFRQKQVGFVTLLNRLRLGRLTALDIEVLHYCGKTVFPDDGIKATRLYPHRYSCDEVNTCELLKLSGEKFKFEAQDWGKEKVFYDQLEKNSKFVKVLELKVGAQVILLTNLSVNSGLVNGARGVVVGFKNKKKELQDAIDQIIVEEGADAIDKETCHGIIETMDEFEDHNEKGYPIVKFVNGTEMTITPQQSTIDIAGRTVAHRIQVPLALAWAVSIHKSQGMTLERIDINIAKAFEHGQAYVALSRVTSLDGLLLRDFDPSKITAHPKVLCYYKTVDSTFDKFSTLGEEELKEFIDRKKNPHKYPVAKKRCDDSTPTQLTEAQPSQLFYTPTCIDCEHDYVKQSCKLPYVSSNTPTITVSPKTPTSFNTSGGVFGINTTNTSKLSNLSNNTQDNIVKASPNNPVSGWQNASSLSINTSLFHKNEDHSKVTVRTMDKKQAKLFKVDPQNIVTLADQSQYVEINGVKMFIQAVHLNNLISKRNPMPNICEQQQQQSISTPSLCKNNDSPTTALRNAEDKLPKRRLALSEVNAQTNTMSKENNHKIIDLTIDENVNNVEKINSDVTVIVESDPEDAVDISLFDNDDFDSKIMKITTPSGEQKNNFLSMICPDLLESATTLSQTKTSGKRKRIDARSSSLNIPTTLTEKNTEADDLRIKSLLIEKEAQIEENRRRALQRRLSSLKRVKQ